MSERWLRQMRGYMPSLRSGGGGHKGQAGRVAVVGGSLEYTGAPYFAAIAALKVGADLAHVFCTERAAPVIKSYSPELIVHPLLDAPNAVKAIETWLERIHVVVLGPGLGRDERVMETSSAIVRYCRRTNKPLVIDADGLFLITEHLDLIQNYPSPGVILTPNKIEFERLYPKIKSATVETASIENPQIDFERLGANVVILRKGATDATFSASEPVQWTNSVGGSARRCGGQGDLLSGSLATFFHWSNAAVSAKGGDPLLAATTACYAAAFLTRNCNEKAFRDKGRSAVCSDMIERIHESIKEFFEPR